MVFVAELVVGVFAEDSAALEVLSCFVYPRALDGSHRLVVMMAIWVSLAYAEVTRKGRRDATRRGLAPRKWNAQCGLGSPVQNISQ